MGSCFAPGLGEGGGTLIGSCFAPGLGEGGGRFSTSLSSASRKIECDCLLRGAPQVSRSLSPSVSTGCALTCSLKSADEESGLPAGEPEKTTAFDGGPPVVGSSPLAGEPEESTAFDGEPPVVENSLLAGEPESGSALDESPAAEESVNVLAWKRDDWAAFSISLLDSRRGVLESGAIIGR